MKLVRGRKKAAASPPKKVRGFKVVSIPKGSSHRQLLAEPDILTSGGARTIHRQTIAH
jgi:hypothetical protein